MGRDTPVSRAGEVTVARKVGKTKLRSVRVPDPQWDRWMAAVEADEQETTISDEIRTAMDRYADRVLGKRR
jgi:hypothetical protein